MQESKQTEQIKEELGAEVFKCSELRGLLDEERGINIDLLNELEMHGSKIQELEVELEQIHKQLNESQESGAQYSNPSIIQLRTTVETLEFELSEALQQLEFRTTQSQHQESDFKLFSRKIVMLQARVGQLMSENQELKTNLRVLKIFN